jgi:hypothetical protein
MKRLALASTAILAAIAFILGRADARGFGGGGFHGGFGGGRVGGPGAGAVDFRGASLGVAGDADAGGLRTSAFRNGGSNNAGWVGAIGNGSIVDRGFAGRGYGRGFGRGLGYGLAGVGLGIGYGLGGFGYDSCDSALGYGAYDPVSCNYFGYGY